MVANPSTVWAQLAVPNPAIGAVPFIGLDAATPLINVSAFWWNQNQNTLSVGCNGDQGGTDAINIYKQLDCYLPVAQQAASSTSLVPPTASTLAAGSTINGISISSSQGTGQLPTANLTGDLLGTVMSWGYNTVSAAWVPLAGEFYYARGAVTGNVGGETHWLTKADGGALIDRVMLDNVGAFQPSTASLVAGTSYISSARLGAANKGFSALTLAYVQAAAPGAATQATPVGQVQIAAGSKTVVVTNSLVTANSIVLAILQTATDATLTQVVAVTPAAGSFTITCNANATGTVKLVYLVIGTDS